MGIWFGLLFLLFALIPDPLSSIPGPWYARFFPCIVSPFILTGRITDTILYFGRFGNQLVRIGRRKIGINDEGLARQVLNSPMRKVPNGSNHPMIKYGLPFVSDPDLAVSLRKVLQNTTLGRETLLKVRNDQLWDLALDPLLNRLGSSPFPIDPETIILDFVRRVIFHLVLELPLETLDMPQIETGIAARNRALETAFGNYPWLVRLAKWWSTGDEPDTEGTQRFMDSILHLTEPPPLVTTMREMGFSEEIIRCHLTTVFQAGTDTTSFALKTICIRLAKNLSVQQSLRICAQQLPDRFHYSDIGHGPIREFVFQTLNEYTPIPILRARVTDSETTLGDFTIPSGTILSISGDQIMRQSQDNPEQHNLSFGDGRRICPGKTLAIIELTMAVSAILRSFHIEDITQAPIDDYIKSLITRYYDKPYLVRFIPLSI